MFDDKSFARLVLGAVFSVQFAACAQSTTLVPTRGYSNTRARFLEAPAISYRLVHNFGHGIDGATPLAGLVGLDHKLYGTTEYGGRNGNGTVFALGVGGSETVLHHFGRRPDGEIPVAGMTRVGKGTTLYGTTEFGGKYNLGTVFEIGTSGVSAGKLTVLYSFSGGNDGAKPMGDVVGLKRGLVIELFGTTSAGGVYVSSKGNGLGTVFKLSISGKTVTENVLHSFGSGSDGATPQSGLLLERNILFGTTSTGGGSGSYGTIFQVTTAGKEQVLVYFDCANGKDPLARLTALGSALYGTTAEGGSGCTGTKSGYGTVFSVGTGYILRTVYSFGAAPDGSLPLAGLTLNRGTFYGATSAAGSAGGGTLFAISPGGRESVLHNFGTARDGSAPIAAPLLMGISFYGTTSAGGKYGGGTVYAFTR